MYIKLWEFFDEICKKNMQNIKDVAYLQSLSRDKIEYFNGWDGKYMKNLNPKPNNPEKY